METITKEQAKKAWKAITAYSMSNISKTTFKREDVTIGLQEAVQILEKYFSED